MRDETTVTPLTARVTHLEMRAPPANRVPTPMGPKLALMATRDMPLAFYRFLYEQVGRPHHWMGRRSMADAALAAIIHAPTTDIRVLYVHGCPAGFFEIDRARASGEAEIVYFGISPAFQGRGLGRFFLSEAIFAAWEQGPERVVIATNTLDNPRALLLYQRAGFVPYAYSEETIQPWAADPA